MQVAQRVEDLQRAADWYERFLGRGPAGLFDPPGLFSVTVDDARLLVERGAPSATIYFRVQDVVEHVETLRADGFTVITEPHVIFRHTNNSLGPAGTEEWMAFLSDSEGSTVGLISQKPY